MTNLAAVLAAPWMLSVLLLFALRRSEQLFEPQWSVRVLGATAVTLALSCWLSVFAAVTVLARAGSPRAVVAAGALAAVLLICLGSAGHHVGRIRAGMAAARIFRSRAATTAGVLILDDDAPDAFAVPGRRDGAVVITSGLLKSLTTAEQAAVFRHERAHLRGRHHLFVQSVELAARLNPILLPWCSAIRYAAEREADEYAAAAGRTAALRAVALASLQSARYRSRADYACRIAQRPTECVRRVLALHGPKPRRQRRRWLAAAAVVVAVLFGDGGALVDVAQDHISPETAERLTAVVG